MTDQPSLTGKPGDAHLMLAFEGTEPPEWVTASLEHGRPAGFSLFRGRNLESPEQTAALTTALQGANQSDHQLLIAADQEGGQLQALPGSTRFGGNMALGAAGSEDLARRVGSAIGSELRAVGINVNYAPAADVATLADNPSLGVRSFGSDPSAVAGLASAMARGMTEAGVLATAKHFPGKGEAAVDPHYELPLLDLNRERMDDVELAPFAALNREGIALTMVGHYLVPALTGSTEHPISVSKEGISALRDDLGFEGVVITDALDMRALDQGAAQVIEFIAMINAGIDLLLVMPDPELRGRAMTALDLGLARGLIRSERLEESRKRIEQLRSTLQPSDPDPSIVGSDPHLELARELADASITLVRSDHRVLPLDPSRSVLVLEPEPVNVTPADTTASYPAALGEEISWLHDHVTSIIYPHEIHEDNIGPLVETATGHDIVVLGTVTATAGQGALARALVAAGKEVVAVALRTPFDLLLYPEVPTYICTYSSHQPTMAALASAFMGQQGFPGQLPVPIGDLYPRGHGAPR